MATLQLAFALEIGFRHDSCALLAFALGPLFPLAYWWLSALAALRDELRALFRGPAPVRISWDIPRDVTAPSQR